MYPWASTDRRHFCHLCDVRDGAPGTPFESLLPHLAPQSQVLCRDEGGAFVSIDVAPIGRGHCIIVTDAHRFSIAHASEAEKQATNRLMKVVASAIHDAFEVDCVFFEHGQCTESDDVTGCGISHAHMHAVALEPERELNRVGDLNFSIVNGGIFSLDEFTSELGYLYIESAHGQGYVAVPRAPASRLLREHFASSAYLDDETAKWNWSDITAYSALLGTNEKVTANLNALRDRIPATTSVSPIR